MGEIATATDTSTTFSALPSSSTTANTTSAKNQFNRFDYAHHESDHHFYQQPNKNRGTNPNPFTDTSSSVYKKIMQEWKLLDRNLPDSIYVRVYERRIDLLQAVIIGANGTPYQDFLFFFDILFPNNYPNKPPSVNYRSFGYLLNPNLYANGTVCLSLLNTWSGRTAERWDPTKSNMLQVLLSIQALVLNEKPFYNEPALGPNFFRGNLEKQSNSYNETVFLRCCKSTLRLLRNPPTNFRTFVRDHFQERGNGILAASHAYRNGVVRIGQCMDMDLGCEEMVSLKGGIRASATFKMELEQIYPQLVMAMREIGVSVLGFLQVMEVEINEQEELGEEEVEKKTRTGFIGKLKMIYDGLKKINKARNGKRATKKLGVL